MSEQDEDARRYMLDVARGDARAQYNLALLFDQGRGGLPQDEREAVRLLKLAAEQGLAAAQCGLGAKYAQGEGGLAQDDHKAALLFELAADQGDASAQCDLGVFCEFGRGGVPRDERKAARLFKLAADKGIPVAQYYLGRMYQQGRGGLPQDAREADRLFKLAAEQRTFRRPSGAQTGDIRPPVWRRRRQGARWVKRRSRPAANEGIRGARTFADGARRSGTTKASRRARSPRAARRQRRRQAEAPEPDRNAQREKEDRRRDGMSAEMNADRALEILGVGARSSEDEIQSAYSHLMKRVHPDLGGSAYFAMELNAARDTLLQSRRHEHSRS